MYFGFRIAQYINYMHVRNLLRNNMLQNELTVLMVNKKDLDSVHWKSYQKEFEYHGQYYDVARTAVKKGISYFYCFPDNKENRLIANYNQKKSGNLPISKMLSKIFLTNFILPHEGAGVLPVVHFYAYNSYRVHFISSFADIHSPPPKQFRLT